ncbi:hypothetical protein DPMN_063387 [Dreissena polymorpha]|uniref:Secreted protein n=1 Tax=Dreissena polymorpha TaxID=45954 RepID=A0A9D4CAF0_DREPO|nr:hypothetical protein DPMN_063387 [Dreissena polymorpha]
MPTSNVFLMILVAECWTMPGMVTTAHCLPMARLDLGSLTRWSDTATIRESFHLCAMTFSRKLKRSVLLRRKMKISRSH